MYKVVANSELAPGYKLVKIHAPLVAAKIQPGQFFVLRIDEKGERIPMSIFEFDRKRGYIETVVHEVGKTTKKLASLEVGDGIMNIIGPLGKPSEIRRYGHVVCICREGTVGAIHPIARSLKRAGNKVTIIVGARSKEYVFLLDKLKKISDEVIVATDDGSMGRKGYAVSALRDFLKSNKVDLILSIGPTLLMKTASKIAKEHGAKAISSLGAIMLDGTGMCGACRVTVGGETKFACVHGPEFDGYKVDFDELKRRQKMYVEEEKIALKEYERLL
jgi:ferredoxin--NADP+ reductase